MSAEARWNELSEAFRQVDYVRDVLREYCLSHDKVPVSVDDLLDAVKQMYGYALITYPMPVQVSHLRGMIVLKDDKTGSIYFDPDMPRPVQRFVCVKEMAHAVILTEANLTLDPTNIIEHYVNEGNCFAAEATADIASEEIAKFIALELLFPRALRAKAKAAIADGSATMRTTGQWLELPENMVEFALSERYERQCDKIWGLVEASKFKAAE
jgi:Zn-dependent peptidase ImmA (M78 family)